jgi:hypothetical protein
LSIWITGFDRERNQMSEPIIFISRNRVREGWLDEFRDHYRTSIPITRESKPDTLIQLAFETEDSTEVTVIRLFPNADALDLQLQGADDRSKKTYEMIEPISMEIFGAPNPSTIEKIKKIAGSGIEVRVHPHSSGGFIR